MEEGKKNASGHKKIYYSTITDKRACYNNC